MSTTKMYVINTLSNMHVGSGEVNYGVIDNLIQRDPVTNLPGINSSGIKGGIREFFTNKNLIEDVFGSDPKDDSNLTKPGKARFFEANILSIPVRSDKVPYMMSTSVEVIKELVYKLNLFNCENKDSIVQKLSDLLNNPNIKSLFETEKKKAIVFDQNLSDTCVEELDIKAEYKNITLDTVLEKLFGKNLVVLSHAAFRTICDDNHLPVMARNNLNDGVSSNLWYEQILPRYTRLYFMLMDGGINTQYAEGFYKSLSGDTFQLGANASIGYGFCKFTELSTLK
ncbi:MAG: type III-B CRISPR module RAMP protein Cmr4 [Bacteroidales bacterium]|jgi:CRISPR-associated protein Cmr4|nr:type III-B CRISPR module RAMP protein Cmr4 [Bacteroidales bacterium]